MCNNSDSILPLMETEKGESSKMRSLHGLPPGCRFYPSDEQILNHYLSGKNSSVATDHADSLIRELNLYDYEPSDLPEGACFVHGYQGKRKHWFCYTESKGGNSKRRAKGGFWVKLGKVRDVFNGEKVVLGTRTKFVFYKVNSVKNSVKKAVRTSWIMYEYALLHHHKASFVLCRVFFKSLCGNSISENILSSCAKESASAVRDVGVQHDRCLTPEIIEGTINGDDFARELYDPVANRPVSITSFELPSGIPPHLPQDLVGSQLSNSDLLSILEEDFIELDDLR